MCGAGGLVWTPPHPLLRKALSHRGRGVKDTNFVGMTTRAVRKGTLRARALRRTQTVEEKTLWLALRNRFLNVKFRRQWPMGGYVVDFVCFEAKLIVELDGSQHAEEAARDYDAVRTEFLEAGGFTVLRFWNNEVRKNLEGVLLEIQKHLP